MNIIEKVAVMHGTTPEEAREAMESALKETGLDIDLERFVLACALLVSEAAPRAAAAGGKDAPGNNEPSEPVTGV